MTHYLDLFDHFVDFIAFCAGLVVIMWLALHSSRRKRAMALPPAAVVGILVWLAVFGFALYLAFG